MILEKKAPLIVSDIKLIYKDLLYSGISEDELINISSTLASTYYTPGSGKLSIDQKENSSGLYYEKELSFSIPSILTNEELVEFKNVGAVVVKTENNRVFCFYHNDFYSNTPIRFVISSETDKTKIKTSIISLKQ